MKVVQLGFNFAQATKEKIDVHFLSLQIWTFTFLPHTSVVHLVLCECEMCSEFRVWRTPPSGSGTRLCVFHRTWWGIAGTGAQMRRTLLTECSAAWRSSLGGCSAIAAQLIQSAYGLLSLSWGESAVLEQLLWDSGEYMFFKKKLLVQIHKIHNDM